MGKMGYHMTSLTQSELLSLNEVKYPRPAPRIASLQEAGYSRRGEIEDLGQFVRKTVNLAPLPYDFLHTKVSLRCVLHDGCSRGLLDGHIVEHDISLSSCAISVEQEYCSWQLSEYYH